MIMIELDEDEIMRIRTRHKAALAAGMSNAEASAYANDPNSPELSFPATTEVKVTAVSPASNGSGAAQSNSCEGSTPIASGASLPPAPALSPTDNSGYREWIDADRLLHVPDDVVFQALLAQDFNSFRVRPGIAFRPNWHLEAMAEKSSQVASGSIRRLIITLPPRNLKSLYASVALPAWFLGHYPFERVVVVSYSDFLTRQHAQDFRLLVKDPTYQATFPAMRLARDTDREITTTQRGKRIATSIDGTLTGVGGNLIIIDDPLKPSDAMSESVRARVNEWYRSTLLSRGDDKAKTRIVVVMQRVHENDLVGYLLEEDGFDVLNLPAIAQRTETFDLGGGRFYTRQNRELLHAEHEPADVLRELKDRMGPIAFSAQYQQSPIPPGGRIIKRKWLSAAYDEIQYQPGDRLIMSWDIALNETDSGDYSACVVLVRRREVFYVYEVVRGRLPFDALKQKVIEVKERYKPWTLLIEDSPISKGLIQSLREQSINVTTYKPDTDKRAASLGKSTSLRGARFGFPGKPHGSRNSPRSCWPFPGAMTIRSMP